MKLKTLAYVLATLPYGMAAQAQVTTTTTATDAATTLDAVTVESSADASAAGLSPAYAGGQVARGARVGVLGTRDAMDTPFSLTSYTNEMIQDRQARGVGDVLQNDPGIRMARGFGNFQESFFIRGFIVSSEDIAYNGLYGLMPRQYIATELFERVEVLRGASSFLTGASPSGGGIGGAINLVPKRALNDPLTRATVGLAGMQGQTAIDVSRRFGQDGEFGLRFNAAHRGGESAIDGDYARTSVASLGLDWRGNNVRLSGDVGWQDNHLRAPRPKVTLASGAGVPVAPDARRNYAQDWSYSDERDVFGTLRGEVDLNEKVTVWGAAGARRSEEDNSLANMMVNDAATWAGSVYRFDNTREDTVHTGEVGVRAKTRTGPIGHEFVVSASHFALKKNNAYAMDFGNQLATGIYNPTNYAKPGFSSTTSVGGELADPRLTGKTRMTSYALGDTLSMFDERLLVTLGIRHQKLSTRDYAYGTSVKTGGYEASRNSPAAGAVFKLTPAVSLYANYIESLSAGQTAPQNANGLPVVNGGESMQPYVSRQKEVGVKYDGGNLGAGLALFTTDKPRGFVDSNQVFSTGGKDRHQGAELTVYGQPSSGVRVLGGLTFLDAKQRETGSSTTDGKRVIGVPRFQSTLGVEWDVPGVQGLALDGRMVHTGSSYAAATNTLRVPSWTRFDAGARYVMDVQGHMVTLRARVDNLFDRNYWASVGGYPDNGYLVLGAPRTFSLSASIEF